MRRGAFLASAAAATALLSIVEALDTLYVMGLDDELSAATRWVLDRLDPDIDGDVQMFEAVIRLVGGLIAGYARAYETVIAKRTPLTLLPTWSDVERGVFTDTVDVAPNPPVDSFNEYLWGGSQMLGDTRCRDWYRMLTDAILKYQVDRSHGALWFRQVDASTAYSFAENFKYLYLMFAEPPRFDPSRYYLSTEGKVLRGLVHA